MSRRRRIPQARLNCLLREELIEGTPGCGFLRILSLMLSFWQRIAFRIVLAAQQTRPHTSEP
jgi:hypothetical protein